jgi:LysR family cyn operon transcriptional activator
MLLRHIRYLLAVADHGNFTRAAEALHVSQPTLSQQIRQFEESLGVPLLDRSGRSVRPTDAGEAYIRYARRALRELEAGQRATHDVQDLLRGSLRLAMTPTFTMYLAGPLIERFHTLHPGIDLRIHEMTQDAIESALADDAIDLAIAFSNVRSAEVECQPLFVEKLGVVIGNSHPFASRQEPLTPKELQAQSLALLTTDFATRAHVSEYFRKQRIAPRISIEANTISAIVEIVSRGNVVTILPEAITLENAALQRLELRPALPHRTVALLRRQDGYRSAASLAFTGLIESMVAHSALP